MAVFTPVERAQVVDFLQAFDIGEVVALEGIPAGIENTNYFLTTRAPRDTRYGTRFVLTLFENLRADELPFYLEFMRALAVAGVEVPHPVADRSGRLVHALCGKPCSIATRLPGESRLQPDARDCAALGHAAARMHLAGAHFMRAQPSLMQPNPRGLAWWRTAAPAVAPHLPPALRALLEQELEAQVTFADTALYRALPAGPVHADLFRNNVLFEGDRLGGVIDFYFGGVDTWLFDVAVAVNDWCIDLATGALDAARADALLRGYASVRPFDSPEREAWPMLLRAAALRFWISRLYDYYLPRAAETLTPHDPAHFERVLRHRRLAVHTLPEGTPA